LLYDTKLAFSELGLWGEREIVFAEKREEKNEILMKKNYCFSEKKPHRRRFYRERHFSLFYGSTRRVNVFNLNNCGINCLFLGFEGSLQSISFPLFPSTYAASEQNNQIRSAINYSLSKRFKVSDRLGKKDKIFILIADY
jgi:hypothetical protein